MKRDRAIQLVSDMLGRLTGGGEDALLATVDEVHVFGSFARGALEPHDVDVAVEYTPTHKQGRVADSPLRRASTSALAYLESQGVNPRSVHLHGKDIDRELTPHFVGIGWRYIDDMHYCLTECDGTQWLEVPRATRSSPQHGIVIQLVDRAKLAAMRDRI